MNVVSWPTDWQTEWLVSKLSNEWIQCNAMPEWENTWFNEWVTDLPSNLVTEETGDRVIQKLIERNMFIVIS
jgi:hypothetical protein